MKRTVFLLAIVTLMGVVLLPATSVSARTVSSNHLCRGRFGHGRVLLLRHRILPAWADDLGRCNQTFEGQGKHALLRHEQCRTGNLGRQDQRFLSRRFRHGVQLEWPPGGHPHHLVEGKDGKHRRRPPVRHQGLLRS